MQSSRNSFRIFRRVDTLLQPTKPKLNQIDLSKSLCTAVSNPKPIPQLLKRSNDPKHPKRRSSPFDALGYELGDNTPPPLDSRVGGHRATIDSIGPSGFTINGVRVSGSVIVMPFFSTFWNVEQMQQVSPQSLALIKLIFPKPDLLILGTGKNIVPVPRDLRDFFKSINVSFDAMDTMNACQTFNVLNQEGRLPAVAMLPLSYEQV